jgi:AraC-like DNA-binding protein
MASVEPEVGVSESVFGLPAPPLRSLVAWYSGYRQAGTSPAVHRGLPSPYLTLIVSLWEPLAIARHPTPQQTPGQFETLAGGLHTSPALIVHQGWQSGIQIALSPLGARALLRVPAAEIAHIDVDADRLLGPAALEMSERAREANTWQDRFAVVDEVLGRRLHAEAAPRIEVASAWRHIVSSNGSISVNRLVRMVGWSSRLLSQRFHAEFGLTPKAAARVVRFDRARRLLQRRAAAGQPPALADLAVECGYYDQAHLASEFRTLAGAPPSRWLAEEFRNLQAWADGPVTWSEA